MRLQNAADNKYVSSTSPEGSRLAHLSEVAIGSVLQMAKGEEQLLVRGVSPFSVRAENTR